MALALSLAVRNLDCALQHELFRHSSCAMPRLSGALDDQGSALVETALVMPIILLLMTGIFSFSTVLYQKLELAQAVSVGARYLAMDRGDSDPCASTATVLYAAAPTLTKSKITLSFNLNGSSYNAATCSGTSGMVSGKSAQVTATYPCSLGVYNMTFGTCSLSVSNSEVVQ